MTSVSAGCIILRQTEPVLSRRTERKRPPGAKARALPTELSRPSDDDDDDDNGEDEDEKKNERQVKNEDIRQAKEEKMSHA